MNKRTTGKNKTKTQNIYLMKRIFTEKNKNKPNRIRQTNSIFHKKRKAQISTTKEIQKDKI